MTRAHRGALVFVELVAAEGAQRLQHPVARQVRVDELHHRLVDEVGEQERRPRAARLVRGAHRLDRVEAEAAGEHADLGEQLLLVGLEQVVRPRHQVVEVAMPGDHRRLRAREQVEAWIEPLGQRLRAHHTHACGSQLDRQRQAVDPPHDAGDRVHVVGTQREPGTRRRRPLDEEPHGRRLTHGREVGVDVGDRQRIDPPDLLSGETEHLAAGGEDREVGGRAEQAFDERRDGGAQVLAVVEHEQHAPAAEVLDERLLDGEVLALLHVDRGRDRGHGRDGIVHGRQLDHEHLTVELVPQIACKPEREPGLSHPTRPRERQQAVRAQLRGERRELGVPTDQ